MILRSLLFAYIPYFRDLISSQNCMIFSEQQILPQNSVCAASFFKKRDLDRPPQQICRIKLSYCILNEWYLTVLPSFSMKWRYIDIEPVLNFIPIKLHRVFLSYNVVTVSSHYLIFYQHMYARQLSNRSIFHAGRYLDDKEICYLGTVIVTANVCRGRL